MSIVALQARARRLGEIRIGDTVPTSSGKTRPRKLDTFRLTSAAKGLLEQAAAEWGGDVTPWQATPNSTPKWQITTATNELPVIVPPQDPDDLTWYESWTAAGLQKRCDGEHIVNKGDKLPCTCDPDDRECHMVTRLRVMLPALPDVGVWQLSSTGYYAASEMSMSLEIVMRAARDTGLLPAATLAIEQREVKRPGEQTKKFAVPVLRFADTLSTFIDAPALAPTVPVPLPGGTAVGEGDGTVQPRLNPPATAPTLDEAIAANPDLVVEAEIIEDQPAVTEDVAWAGLYDILNEPPIEGNMGIIQDRCRRLYRFMAATELWGEHALEAALAKTHAVESITDLRRAELEVFANQSFNAAIDKASEQNDG